MIRSSDELPMTKYSTYISGKLKTMTKGVYLPNIVNTGGTKNLKFVKM